MWIFPPILNGNGFKGVLFGVASESWGPLVIVITVSLKALVGCCFFFWHQINILITKCEVKIWQ